MTLFLILAGLIVLALVIGFIAWLLSSEEVVVVEDNGVGYIPSSPYYRAPYGSTVIVEDDDDYVVPAILAADVLNTGFGYNNHVVVDEPEVVYGNPGADLDVPYVPQGNTYTNPDLDVPAVPAFDTPSSRDLDVPSVPDTDTGSSWSDNSGGGS